MWKRATLTLLVMTCSHADEPSSAASPWAGVKVSSVGVPALSKELVRFRVSLAATSQRSLSVKRIDVIDLKLNGISVYAEPLTRPFRMNAGRHVNLPDIDLSIRVDDLEDAEPVQRALRSKRISVSCQMMVEFEKGVIERIFTAGHEPVVYVAVAEVVDLRVPTFVAQAMALMAPGVASGTVRLRRFVVGPSEYDRYLESVIIARTTFRLIGKNGHSEPVDCQRLGFRTGADTALFPGEVVAPWSCLPEVAASLQSGESTLDRNSIETTLTFHSGHRLKLSRREFSIERADLKLRKRFVMRAGRLRSVSIADTVDSDNVAVLKLGSQAPADNALALRTVASPGRAAIAAILVRPLHIRKPGGWLLRPSNVQCSLTSDQHVCSPGADSAAWGSPLITQQGVIGMLGRSGTVIEVSRHLAIHGKS